MAVPSKAAANLQINQELATIPAIFLFRCRTQIDEKRSNALRIMFVEEIYVKDNTFHIF